MSARWLDTAAERDEEIRRIDQGETYDNREESD